MRTKLQIKWTMKSQLLCKFHKMLILLQYLFAYTNNSS